MNNIRNGRFVTLKPLLSIKTQSESVQQSNIETMYAVKYLGITNGKLGVLSKRFPMSKLVKAKSFYSVNFKKINDSDNEASVDINTKNILMNEYDSFQKNSGLPATTKSNNVKIKFLDRSDLPEMNSNKKTIERNQCNFKGSNFASSQHETDDVPSNNDAFILSPKFEHPLILPSEKILNKTSKNINSHYHYMTPNTFNTDKSNKGGEYPMKNTVIQINNNIQEKEVGFKGGKMSFTEFSKKKFSPRSFRDKDIIKIYNILSKMSKAKPISTNCIKGKAHNKVVIKENKTTNIIVKPSNEFINKLVLYQEDSNACLIKNNEIINSLLNNDDINKHTIPNISSSVSISNREYV